MYIQNCMIFGSFYKAKLTTVNVEELWRIRYETIALMSIKNTRLPCFRRGAVGYL